MKNSEKYFLKHFIHKALTAREKEAISSLFLDLPQIIDRDVLNIEEITLKNNIMDKLKTISELLPLRLKRDKFEIWHIRPNAFISRLFKFYLMLTYTLKKGGYESEAQYALQITTQFLDLIDKKDLDILYDSDYDHLFLYVFIREFDGTQLASILKTDFHSSRYFDIIGRDSSFEYDQEELISNVNQIGKFIKEIKERINTDPYITLLIGSLYLSFNKDRKEIKERINTDPYITLLIGSLYLSFNKDRKITHLLIKILFAFLLGEFPDGIFIRYNRVYRIYYNYTEFIQQILYAISRNDYNILKKIFRFFPKTFEISRIRLIELVLNTILYLRLWPTLEFYKYLWSAVKDVNEYHLTSLLEKVEAVLELVYGKEKVVLAFERLISNTKDKKLERLILNYFSHSKDIDREIKSKEEEYNRLIKNITKILDTSSLSSKEYKNLLLYLSKLIPDHINLKSKDEIFRILGKIKTKYPKIIEDYFNLLISKLEEELISYINDEMDSDLADKIFMHLPEWLYFEKYEWVFSHLISLDINSRLIYEKLKPALERLPKNEKYYNVVEALADVYFQDEQEKLRFFKEKYEYLFENYQSAKDFVFLDQMLPLVKKIEQIDPALARKIKTESLIPALREIPLPDKNWIFTPHYESHYPWIFVRFFIKEIPRIIRMEEVQASGEIKNTIFESILVERELISLINTVCKEKSREKIISQIERYISRHLSIVDLNYTILILEKIKEQFKNCSEVKLNKLQFIFGTVLIFLEELK